MKNNFSNQPTFERKFLAYVFIQVHLSLYMYFFVDEAIAHYGSGDLGFGIFSQASLKI